MTSPEDIARFCREFQRVGDEINEVIVGFQPTPDDSLDEIEECLRQTQLKFSALQKERRLLQVPDELLEAVLAVGEALDLQEVGYEGSLNAIEAGDLTDLATKAGVLAMAADMLNQAQIRFLATVEVVTGRKRKPDA